MVFAVDRDGKIIFWNEGAEKITGHLRQDILGRSCSGEFLEHSDANNNPLLGEAIPLIKTMREGRANSGRFSLRAKNGHFVALKLHMLPIRNDMGSVQGAVEVFEETAPPVVNNRRMNRLATYGCLDTTTGVCNRVMTGNGGDRLKTLAQELGKLPNKMAIEGHTDSKPYPPTATYTNWELPAGRANAARRFMQQSGIAADQITQVRGFADQRLRKPDAPLDPGNRRISLIMQYLQKTAATDSAEPAERAEGGEKPKKRSPQQEPKKQGTLEKPSLNRKRINQRVAVSESKSFNFNKLT